MYVSAHVFVYAKFDFVCMYVVCVHYLLVCVCVCVCVFVRLLYIGCSDVCIELFLASFRIARFISPELHLKPQSVPQSEHFLLSYKNQSVNAVWGNNCCLFSNPHKTQKYTVCAECRIAEY